MAAISGNIGKAQLGMNAASKEELMKDKQAKDKIALQENSLVAFAMAEQPDIYAPNTLPFFSHNPSHNVKVLEELSTPGLKKEESIVSAKLQREQSSTLKL